jgi:hypothetical protein
MSVPLGRTARRWALLILFAGLAILVALAWTVFDLHHPTLETSLSPEHSDRFPKATAPTIEPIQRQIQPPKNRFARTDTGSTIVELTVVPALSGHKLVAQPTADLSRDESVDVKFALIKGLQNLRAWARGRVDAGEPSTN